jgi:LPXTG-site transpeptidase (sortase) family protein
MLPGFLSNRVRRGPDNPAGSAPRGRLSRIVAAAGLLGIFLGGALIALGLYTYINDGEASIPEEPAALAGRFDPGSVYDRPVGAVTPTPAPTAAPTAAITPTPAPAAAVAPPPLRDKPYNIVIEKIGVDAGVFTYGLDANSVPEVPYNGWDVAWYNFSAQPGTGSNAVFAGHVTWSGPAVFYHLDALLPGDVVKLTAVDGTVLTYRVTETFLVDPSDPNSLQVMAGTDSDVITLITCGGTPFYVGGTAGYDYTDRRIVRGELVEISQV